MKESLNCDYHEFFVFKTQIFILATQPTQIEDCMREDRPGKIVRM